MAGISWREWGEEPQAESRQTGKPLLLLLGASWCRFCRELADGVLSEPAVAAAVERRFIPVRADKDRHRDADERFRRGGWPTLVVIAENGDVVAGGSGLDDDEIRALLLEKGDLRPAPPPTSGFSPKLVDRVAQAMLEGFDPRHGGFGTGPKFPHPEAVDFALLYAEKTGNPAFREVALKTLTEMANGALLDPVEGGFFRYCATRDWRQPCTEKRLDVQAGLLRNYLEGWQLFGRAEFRKAAQKTLSFLEHVLRDPATGAWFSGQEGDDSFFALSERARTDRQPPRVEKRIYARSLSAAISAVLKAGAVLGDEHATRRALEATKFLVETLYSPGKGVYHSFDQEQGRHILGLLADQVYAVRALLHVVQFTGDNGPLAMVEDLLSLVARRQSTDGGFYELRDDDPKFHATRRRNNALLENGLLAEALVRAHCLTAKRGYLDMAGRALAAFAHDHPLYGYFSAEYGRAVEIWFHPPIRAVVVGPAADPRRQALADVARRTYAPSKLVLALDPETDRDLLARHAFPARPESVAYVCTEGACVAEVTDPDVLPGAMMQAETLRSRRATLKA
jgi:uncharacterized protein YyaL (SSP411 family)